MAGTTPVRVPKDVHNQVLTAARLLGCPTSDLLSRAWTVFSKSAEFRAQFDEVRKAFAVGDLDLVANRLYENGLERAESRARAVQRLREE